MLAPFIIDEIRRREDELRQPFERPCLEPPRPSELEPRPERFPAASEEESSRGVEILDIL